MTPEEFCRWLQGFAELHGEPPNASQWNSIREHLQLLYQKKTSDLKDLVDAVRAPRHETPGRIC